jgi:hypothetical protein
VTGCWRKFQNEVFLKQRDYSKCKGIDGKMSNWMLGHRINECVLDPSGSVYRLLTSSCEHDDMSLAFVKCGEFLTS